MITSTILDFSFYSIVRYRLLCPGNSQSKHCYFVFCHVSYFLILPCQVMGKLVEMDTNYSHDHYLVPFFTNFIQALHAHRAKGMVSISKMVKHSCSEYENIFIAYFYLYLPRFSLCDPIQSIHFADDTHLLNINKSAKKVRKQLNIDLKLL